MREGKASAGKMIIRASGCNPWTMPVAKVANPIFFFPTTGASRESYMLTSHSPFSRTTQGAGDSDASLIPMAPITSKVKPTTLVPHVRRISIWSRSLSSRNSKPKINCPASWPHPQSAPTRALSTLVRPIESGAKAARWSGPDSVCKQPAKKPVQALLSSSVRTIFPLTAEAAENPVAYAEEVIIGWTKSTKRADTSSTAPAVMTWNILERTSCLVYQESIRITTLNMVE